MTDTRRRVLIGLGAAAFVSLALSGLVLWQRTAEGLPHYPPTEVLPGFSANVKNAVSIHIASHSGSFDVVNAPGKGWVLPAHGGYSADYEQVRHTLIGLAALQTIAPKTNRADWLHYVSLDAPPAGNGIEITVKDASGKVLAALITGNSEDLGDPSGTSGLFVRYPGQNQTWLARSVFRPEGDVAAWLSSHLLDISPARLAEIAITPLKGPPFVVHRASANEHIFTLANPPKGEVNMQFVNVIPYSVGTLSLVDAAPVATVDFAKSAHVVAKSFDGLVATMDVVEKGDDIWTRISAAAGPGASPAVVQEAAGINAKAAGLAFELPPEKGNALLSDLPKLMTPMPQQPDAGMGGLMPGMMGTP